MLRLTAPFTERRRDRDLADELESHLQLHIDDYLRSGMTPEDARRAARLALGSLEAVKEDYRDRAGLPWLRAIARDLRYGARSLRKTPGFTVGATLVLALGVGVNTAIFSVVRASLLRPLPIRDDGRVAVIWIDNQSLGRSRVGPSGLDYLDWTEQNTPFEELFLFEHGSGTITGGGEPDQVRGLRVTTNFAEFVGVRPILGRAFEPADSTQNTILLTAPYWQRRFNADPAVVGRGLTLNGEVYTVIGVLPADACFWYPADVVVPWPIARLRQADSELGVFGRLKPSATFGSAQAEMNIVAARVASARPGDRTGWGIVVVPIRDVAVQYIRPALLVLLGAVALVLLIACANVAGLLLVRTIGRLKEIAIRTALGASRGRLVQQMFVESGLLGLAGGAVGLLAATWGDALLRVVMPASIPVPAAASKVPLPQSHIDLAVLGFALLVSIAVSVIFGLGPVLICLRSRPADALGDGARLTGPTAGTGRQRAALIVTESALAIVLLIGSGLMMTSFWNLMTVRPGFSPQDLVTVQIKFPDDAPDSKYRQPAARAAAVGQFLDRVRAIPSVQSAAFTEILPMSQDDQHTGGFFVAERGFTPSDQFTGDFRIVTAGYFETMAIPLRAGRVFTAFDTADVQRVAIIDETLARTCFGSADPIGRHLNLGDPSHPAREIVGVVGSVLDEGLDKAPRSTIYIPYPQAPAQTMSLVVRTKMDAGAIVPLMKRAIWTVDPMQPLFNVRRVTDILADTISSRRVAFVLLVVFAAVALTLAVVGIYSVTSYGVEQRGREIGVRMALGARRTDVLWLIVGGGMRQAAAGLALGLVVAGLLSHTLSSLLYAVAPLDARIFIAVGGTFGAVALLANGIPAWRAANPNVVHALWRG